MFVLCLDSVTSTSLEDKSDFGYMQRTGEDAEYQIVP